MSGGVPMHYKVKFIGKLSELARNIGQDKLASLDFSGDNIASFDPKGQFSNNTVRDLVFPLSARSDRFVYNSGQAASGIEGATNIAYHSNGTHEGYGVKEQDLTGAMKVGRILQLIEDKYGLSFSGATDNDYIDELYLWLNKVDQNRDGEPYSAFASSLTGGSSIDEIDVNNDAIIFNGFPAQIRHRVRIKGTWTGDVVLKMILDGQVVGETNVSGDYTNQILMGTNSGTFQVIAESASSVTVSVTVQMSEEEFDRDYYYGNYWRATGVVTTITGTAGVGTAGTYALTNHIPDLKIMDFLSILFKKFNLIAEVSENNNVITKHYDHFMSEGVVRDVTKYVHADRYQINRPNLYSAMKFEFADSKTALEQGYLKVNGRQYAELGYELVGTKGSRLTGSEYSLKINSQRIPLEPLIDLDNQADTTVNYCLFADLKGAEQQTAAAFTYVRKITGQVFGDSSLSWENGTGVDEITTYIQPSNTFAPAGAKPIESNVELGLFFGEETDENNLYNHTSGLGLWRNFYRGLTAQMFDEDKRSAKFTAEFNQAILSKLSIADVLKINNSYYNINSIETNYLTGRSKLDLILVGRARLPQTTLLSTAITNDSSTQVLYLTFIDVNGNISKQSIATGVTENYYTIGGVVSYSHANYTEEGQL
mgnify:FL=1